LQHLLDTSPSLKTLKLSNCDVLDEKKKVVPVEKLKQALRQSSVRQFEHNEVHVTL
jgi:hypothetical protein